ncbi:MAG: phosphotransferase family protein [Candidatus Odinarchaeota archaeon]
MNLNEHAIEVLELLKSNKLIPEDSNLSNYNQLEGGADTIIYEIGVVNHSKKYIQRIRRPTNPLNISNEVTEFEYGVQKTLFENNIAVSKPYLLKLTPNTRESPYFIMEKINGTRLDYLLESDPEQSVKLIEKFIQELFKIHSIDIKLFPQIPTPDIQNNPFAAIDQFLLKKLEQVKRFDKDLSELRPVINWLEKNKFKNPCKKLVLIHGDYHPPNIIVQEDGKFRILDWRNIAISDFRRELGFTTATLNCFTKINLAPLITKIYEQNSGWKVENLSYFIILAMLSNLIRLYNAINNPIITNENEETLNFFKSIKDYPLYLVELIKETCNIELSQIKNYFKNC